MLSWGETRTRYTYEILITDSHRMNESNELRSNPMIDTFNMSFSFIFISILRYLNLLFKWKDASL